MYISISYYNITTTSTTNGNTKHTNHNSHATNTSNHNDNDKLAVSEASRLTCHT